MVAIVRRRCRWLDARRGQLQQLAAAGEFGLAVAVGQKAVMADVLKPFRGNMQEEAANELVGGQGHGLFRRPVLVVLPEEGNAAIAETTGQAVVGDRHAMSVAGEIVEHVVGTAEGGLGIHHPLGLRGRGEIGGEGVGVAQRSAIDPSISSNC